MAIVSSAWRIVRREPGASCARYTAAGYRFSEKVASLRSWKSWAGNFSLEEMARRADIPGTMYNLMYRLDSRAVHARDAGYYVEVRSGGVLAMRMPERVEQHLMPVSSCVLMALKLLGEMLGVNREAELDGLMFEIQRVAGV